MATGMVTKQDVGTLAALGQAIQVAVQYDGIFGVQVTGTFTATIVFEGSLDYDFTNPSGATWFALTAYNLNAIGQSNVTAPGQFFIPTAGIIQMRARMSAFTSGSAKLFIDTGVGSPIVNTGVVGQTPTLIQTNATVTASANSGDLTVPPGVAYVQLLVIVNGAVTGTSPTLAYTIQFKDPQLGTQYYNILTGVNMTATGGTQVLNVGTTTTNVNNIAAPGMLPSTIRISWAAGGTTPSFAGVYATLTWMSG